MILIDVVHSTIGGISPQLPSSETRRAIHTPTTVYRQTPAIHRSYQPERAVWSQSEGQPKRLCESSRALLYTLQIFNIVIPPRASVPVIRHPPFLPFVDMMQVSASAKPNRTNSVTD